MATEARVGGTTASGEWGWEEGGGLVGGQVETLELNFQRYAYHIGRQSVVFDLALKSELIDELNLVCQTGWNENLQDVGPPGTGLGSSE